MKLYCVTNTSGYPMQCITVSDSKAKAESICNLVKRKFPDIAGCVYVEKVDSFYPSHMTDADKAISDAIKMESGH